MQFESLSDALSMGGHGPFVWTAILVSLAIIGWLVVSPLVRKKRILAEVAREMRREQVREQSSAEELV